MALSRRAGETPPMMPAAPGGPLQERTGRPCAPSGVVAVISRASRAGLRPQPRARHPGRRRRAARHAPRPRLRGRARPGGPRRLPSTSSRPIPCTPRRRSGSACAARTTCSAASSRTPSSPPRRSPTRSSRDDARAPEGWSREFGRRVRGGGPGRLLRVRPARTPARRPRAARAWAGAGQARARLRRARAGGRPRCRRAGGAARRRSTRPSWPGMGSCSRRTSPRSRPTASARCGSAGLVASYYGTQRLTRDNHGERVYGGSDLLVVRGELRRAARARLPDDARALAVGAGTRYDAAAQACSRGSSPRAATTTWREGSMPAAGRARACWSSPGASAAPAAPRSPRSRRSGPTPRCASCAPRRSRSTARARPCHRARSCYFQGVDDAGRADHQVRDGRGRMPTRDEAVEIARRRRARSPARW